MVPHRISIVELPSPVEIRLIWVYLKMEQTVVNRPSKKIPIRPSFLASRILSLNKTGKGRMATTMSDTMVTTA